MLAYGPAYQDIGIEFPWIQHRVRIRFALQRVSQYFLTVIICDISDDAMGALRNGRFTSIHGPCIKYADPL